MLSDYTTIITSNIRAGGGKRISSLVERLAAHESDILVITEFRNGQTGDNLRQSLERCGFTWQLCPTAEKSLNTVLVASRLPFTRIELSGLAVVDSHRCV